MCTKVSILRQNFTYFDNYTGHVIWNIVGSLNACSDNENNNNYTDTIHWEL